jgi:hypothetical protein
MARDFAVVQPDVYTQLAHAGWDISQPLWKPDSTQVIFDRPGNVDFTLEETAALDSLGAVRVPDSQVRDWLRNNGWILEGE